jgi:N-acyl-D-amino-acid deacylase
MFDLSITNGLVYDGAGNPYVKVNIGINNGKIVEPNPLDLKKDSRNIIDAEGLAVSPGFIDIHAHSDLGLLLNPTADNKVLQGVTTEVNGNCGSSAGPLVGLSIEETRKFLERSGRELEWLTARAESHECKSIINHTQSLLYIRRK